MKFLPLILITACTIFAAEPPSLYERVAARLSSRPDLAHLGQPPSELAQVEWMPGTWQIEVRVTGEDRVERGTSVISWVVGNCWLQLADSYPTGIQDIGFLTYNVVSKQWISIGLDSAGHAVKSTARAWEANRLVLLAPDTEVVGEKVTLRQTITRVSVDEFVLSNDELLPNGEWRPVDEYRYRRK